MKKINVDPGTVFNDWTVISECDGIGKDRRFLCRCVCGKEKPCFLHLLRSGSTRGCGCKRNKENKERETTHGLSYSKEYYAWRAMHWRCDEHCDKETYKNYGGRGIKVCDRWKSFELFIEDMGKKPSPDHEIERSDNNKGYSPDNCRWATNKENSRNKRNNFLVEKDGKTKCLSEWCEIYHLAYGKVYYRMKKFGMSLDEAMTAIS